MYIWAKTTDRHAVLAVPEICVGGELLVTGEREPFPGLCEEEVVALAQSGNERALGWILERYKETVRLKSRSYYLVGGDREDVVQEGMIGLFKAVRDYNRAKNASFRTFADLCITRHIITAVKSATRQKHVPLNYYISLSGGEVANDFYEASVRRKNVNPEQLVIERENIAGMECRIDKLLSGFEARVLMYHLQGVKYGQIAKLLGRKPKSIDNALQRIKRKVEQYLTVGAL